MPNWNYNYVTFSAPQEEVKNYLVKEKNYYYFNMHILFPERFGSSDLIWNKNWDYDWCVENTGSNWYPKVTLGVNQTGLLIMDYDTEWAPNNRTLLRLSLVANCEVMNEYEEPWMWFEGEFICENWVIKLDECWEYNPECSACGIKYPESKMAHDEESYGWTCDSCTKQT